MMRLFYFCTEIKIRDFLEIPHLILIICPDTNLVFVVTWFRLQSSATDIPCFRAMLDSDSPLRTLWIDNPDLLAGRLVLVKT